MSAQFDDEDSLFCALTVAEVSTWRGPLEPGRFWGSLILTSQHSLIGKCPPARRPVIPVIAFFCRHPLLDTRRAGD